MKKVIKPDKNQTPTPEDLKSEISPRFFARMVELLGDEYPAFEAIYDQPATHGLRVNPLKLEAEQFYAISPFVLSPIPWSPDGFWVTEDGTGDRQFSVGKHPYHAAGLYYLQDPHAQAVAEILDPQPGERVLDLAAAPGGKTTQIASLMRNQGLLVANEIKTKRIGHLTANLERWGARNVAIVNETPERLAEFFGPFFDRVLVDAPCSGEGMFRKDRSARIDWSEVMVAGCAVRQTAILNYAARLVRPSGWLVYSTCTFAPEEDEGVVERFLAEQPDFELAEAAVQEDLPKGGNPGISEGVRLWPHHSAGEGHFIALLQRTAKGAISQLRVASRNQKRQFAPAGLSRPVQSLYEAWCGENLTALPAVEVVEQMGSRLYALPAGLPDLAGLRVVHPGWWLGVVKKDRFEPEHALAMGLGCCGDEGAAPARALAFAPDSPEVQAFLQCETLSSEGAAGWLVVGVSPAAGLYFPMGWGKRVQGVVKNHYPRGLLRG